MKRMISLILVTGILSAAALSFPVMTEISLPEVTVVSLKEETITPKVYATGKLEEKNQKEITCDFPVVPQQVYVDVGEWVEAGDVLASVDLEKTVDAILNLTKATEYLPQDILKQLGNLDFELLQSQIPQEIVATSSGMVSNLNLDVGALAYPTQAVATISPDHVLRAKLSVPEEYANEVETGQKVKVKVGALDGEKFDGTISLVFPSAHQTISGTSQETVVNIYADLTEGSEGLKAGYTVSGEIFTDESRSIMTLPYTAIDQDESGQEYVYLYRKGKAFRQDVEIGEELEESAEILSGVENGDYVIADCSKIEKSGTYVNLVGEE